MVCGEFGSPSLAPYSSKIAMFNAVWSVLAVCFGIVGCVSYTNKANAIENASWMKVSMLVPAGENSETMAEAKTFFGIRSQVSEFTLGDLVVQSDVETYEACAKEDPTDEFCVECDKSAVATVSMCSLALIAAGVAFLTYVMRVSCDSAFAKDLGLLAGGASVGFGIISYSVFSKCHGVAKDMEELVDDADTMSLKWGPGAQLVLGSFVLMFVVTVINLVTPVEQEAEEVETEDKLEAKA